LLRHTNVREQRHRVERGELLAQVLLGGFVDPLAGEQPLIGGERQMVRLRTNAPSRCLLASLNEGWKKLTYSRALSYRRWSAPAAASPRSRPYPARRRTTALFFCSTQA
jgi:hypothetical protein